MRGVIVVVAVLCYAVAFTVTGAALRLPPPQRSATIEELAREQAAGRELVEDLRDTVAQLQEQLKQPREPRHPAEPAVGRVIARLGGEVFTPGQAKLRPGDRDAIAALLPEIRSVPDAIVVVEGHADSRPVREPSRNIFTDNADLSLLRARAVAAVLLKAGVPEAQVRVQGWGDTHPLATNDTPEGRERNRRVEVRLVPGLPAP